jgi:S1-C subfamily serine protease
MHIHSPQSLLISGSILLTATLVLGSQQEASTAHRVETINEPVNQVSVQSFDKSFESFAPTVKKVAPGVVKIITTLKSDSFANPAARIENPLSRSQFAEKARHKRALLRVWSNGGSHFILIKD